MAEPTVYERLHQHGAHLVLNAPDPDEPKRLRPCWTKWQKRPWDPSKPLPARQAPTVHGHVPKALGFLGVDVDSKDKPKGPERQRALIQRTKLVTDLIGEPAFASRTRNGGAHLYYPVKDGPVPESVNSPMSDEPGNHIGDVRYTGQLYLWEPERLLAFLEREDRPHPANTAADLFARLAPLLTEPAVDGTPLTGLLDGERPKVGQRIDPESTRNNRMYRRALAAVGNDQDPKPALRRAARIAADSGLGDKEIETTLLSAAVKSRVAHQREAEDEQPQALDPEDPFAEDEALEARVLDSAEMKELKEALPQLVADGAKDAQDAPAAVLNHDELAELWVEQHGQGWRYVPPLDQWRRWQPGTGWTEDEDGERVLSIAETARQSYSKVVKVKTPGGGSSESIVPDVKGRGQVETIHGGLRMARARVAAPVAAWDADAHALGLPGARLLDLGSGKARAQVPEDLVWRRAGAAFTAPVRPGNPMLAWLHEKLPDDDDRSWLKRWTGYQLWGDASEQIALFLFGPTATGKSTYAAMLQALMGGLAASMDGHLFETAKNASQPNERRYALAGVQPARSILVNEWRKNAGIDSAWLSQITGGDRLEARQPAGRRFDYIPRWKLTFVGNQLPASGLDGPVRRRLAAIRMEVQHDQQIDREMTRKLVSKHLEDFAAWALEGLREWRAQGLRPIPGERHFERVDAGWKGGDPPPEFPDLDLDEDLVELILGGAEIVLDPDSSAERPRVHTLACLRVYDRWDPSTPVGRDLHRRVARLLKERFAVKTVRGRECYVGLGIAEQPQGKDQIH